MQHSGYYEIINHSAQQLGLKVSSMAGNVLFNRLHWHDSLEIMCCLCGSFQINIQGMSYILNEGDLITINPGLSHEISEGTPDGLQLIFSVDSSLLRLAGDEIYDFSTVTENKMKPDHEDTVMVRQAIARLTFMLTPEIPDASQISDLESGIFSIDTRIQSLTDEQWYQFHMELYRILMCLSKHKKKTPNPAHLSKPFAHFTSCVEFIHQNYDKPLSAGKVAEAVGFSEPTIYRLFQTHMGISFTTYLNSVRISAACGFIENSAYSMTEISQVCGFSSLSNFYRVFAQLTGMAPREYRKFRGIAAAPRYEAQKDIMLLNRFQPFWQLPYTREELLQKAKSVSEK